MSFNTVNFDWLIPSVGADRNTWGRLLNNFIANDPSGQNLDAYLFQLTNTNAGSSSPTYPTNLVAGRQWLDTTNANQYLWKLYNGAAWVTTGVIDNTNNSFFIPGSNLVVGQMILWAGVGLVPQFWLKCDGTDISRTTYDSLFNTITFTRTCDTSSGSAVLSNLSSTSDLYVGMNVELTGAPYPSTILTIDSATQVTLNNVVSASQTGVAARFLPYGAAAVQTDFKLPDLAGRTAKASGSNGQINYANVGQSGGKDLTNDIVQHTHNAPSVGSAVNGFVAGANGGSKDINNAGGGLNRVEGYPTTSTVNSNSISGVATADMDIRNPYQVINSYIIFAGA